MNDKFDGVVTRFHAFYPTGFVVSVFKDSGDAGKAQTALQSIGFSDVRLLSPDEVRQRAAEDLSRWNRLDEFVNHASDAATVSLRYLQLAKEGQTFILVKAEESFDVSHLKTTLKQFRGHTTYQYNRFTFLPLDQ